MKIPEFALIKFSINTKEKGNRKYMEEVMNSLFLKGSKEECNKHNMNIKDKGKIGMFEKADRKLPNPKTKYGVFKYLNKKNEGIIKINVNKFKLKNKRISETRIINIFLLKVKCFLYNFTSSKVSKCSIFPKNIEK